LEFIQPGKPAQNAHLESFNDRLRDECLNGKTKSHGAEPIKVRAKK